MKISFTVWEKKRERDNKLELYFANQRKKRVSVVAAACAAAAIATADVRDGTFTVCQHLDWHSHAAMLNAEGPTKFYMMYRMHLPAFEKLCSIIEPHLKHDQCRAKYQTGRDDPITTEISLHCLLC